MAGQQRDTRKEIEFAISRIQHGRPKRVDPAKPLNIATVAKEAGISNATIHNRYPDIAERIRTMIEEARPEEPEGESARPKRGQRLQERLKALRQENEKLKQDLARSQSINLRLLKENEALKMRGAMVAISGGGTPT